MKEILFASLVLFVILGQVPVSCFPNRRSGHSEAENISKTDACPHLQNNPGEKIVKLRPLVVDQTNRLCCGCGEGQRLAGPCQESSYTSTRCEDCPPNTYMDLPVHFNSECFMVPNNLHCPDDQIYIPYTATSKPECRCRDDHYRTSNGTCLPHTACGFGKGVKRLGNHNSDTVCEVCEEHFESNSTSSTEKCRLKQSVHNHPKNLEPTDEPVTVNEASTIIVKTQQNFRTQATSNKTTFDMTGIYVIIGVILGICFVIFIIIIILKKNTKIFRKKPNTKVPRKEDNTLSSVANKKENFSFQSVRLLNKENMNESAQTEEEKKRNSFLKKVQKGPKVQRLRNKSCEIMELTLTSCRRSSKSNDDESEPTSSNNYLPANDHEQEESSESSNEHEEHNEEEFEKEKQKKVVEYFHGVSTSNGYCFLGGDVNLLKDSYGIYIESDTTDSFGMQMYKVVKGGFDQNKLTVEKLFKHLKAKNLNTIVQELERVL